MAETTPTQPPPEDDDRRPFEHTKTKFGIIQREIERTGLPSHSFNVSKEHALDHNFHQGEILSGNLNISTTESILGVDVSAETDVSLFKLSEDSINSDKKNKIGAEVDFGNAIASARAGFGLTGIGAKAGAEVDLVSANIGPISASLGLGVDTGAFVSPTQASIHILGTGVSVGEKTSISILGSSVTIDVAKVIEETGNHFVHGKDPHQQISKKIHSGEHHIEIKLGLDKVETRLVGSVGNRLEPLENEIRDGISVVKENSKDPIDKEIRDHVIQPIRHLLHHHESGGGSENPNLTEKWENT